MGALVRISPKKVVSENHALDTSLVRGSFFILNNRMQSYIYLFSFVSFPIQDSEIRADNWKLEQRVKKERRS